jgi:hypothetical protein
MPIREQPIYHIGTKESSCTSDEHALHETLLILRRNSLSLPGARLIAHGADESKNYNYCTDTSLTESADIIVEAKRTSAL